MRTIKYIVAHCTAGHQTQTLQDILNEFRLPPPKGRGWKSPGYHHLIMPDGTIHDLLPIEQESNGVLGYNANSIHYSYVGGIDKSGKATDNRTPQQEASQIHLILRYQKMFPNAVHLGHRDFSRDTNGNGKIDTWEMIKQCPCYDHRDFLKKNGLDNITRPVGIVYKFNKPLIKDSFVVKIQQALKKSGILNEQGKEITIDSGYFGAECDYCVKSFQRLTGLEVNGIVDDATKKALKI